MPVDEATSMIGISKIHLLKIKHSVKDLTIELTLKIKRIFHKNG